MSDDWYEPSHRGRVLAFKWLGKRRFCPRFRPLDADHTMGTYVSDPTARYMTLHFPRDPSDATRRRLVCGGAGVSSHCSSSSRAPNSSRGLSLTLDHRNQIRALDDSRRGLENDRGLETPKSDDHFVLNIRSPSFPLGI
ncbi:hypothetical protein RHMOL_Rhmol06G0124500 [Rhododendron molle]|uniref:Uncharacterized protein n=1 Tax=Rhododendron molle TaxID=49168 RepID=A0ACC0NDU9_RHOML|nr:hypothetical protein RHMOL_Rhmol06G0124500 [Rhododendron molle]